MFQTKNFKEPGFPVPFIAMLMGIGKMMAPV